MSEQEIVERVNRLLAKGFEVKTDVLNPEALIYDDLGLDSLDSVDLVVALEREFGCRITEEEARAMRRLKDIHEYVRRQVVGREEKH